MAIAAGAAAPGARVRAARGGMPCWPLSAGAVRSKRGRDVLPGAATASCLKGHGAGVRWTRLRRQAAAGQADWHGRDELAGQSRRAHSDPDAVGSNLHQDWAGPVHPRRPPGTRISEVPDRAPGPRPAVSDEEGRRDHRDGAGAARWGALRGDLAGAHRLGVARAGLPRPAEGGPGGGREGAAPRHGGGRRPRSLPPEGRRRPAPACARRPGHRPQHRPRRAHRRLGHRLRRGAGLPGGGGKRQAVPGGHWAHAAPRRRLCAPRR
mmetsp:Transcript_106838/g.335077  ORF Transcript_106838/g.335077 Transcript_106838/m.335077 type:complete len:265 (+) Transcript_106838:2067-2861(+)